ncbi:MAG: hypothetical protein LUB62_03740, partial [Prevotellaceae bacterium]|nr:hypothetical protein [Prevotellaceae bacterium]
DLGLSVKWATCNVGASSPSDYGDYFAWGETSTKTSYDEDNSTTYGVEMEDISGVSRYDVARAKWGGSWRIPTGDEIDELIDNCTWELTTLDEVNGYKITGTNGNSIFLPAAGWHLESSLLYAGQFGNYWCATPYESDTEYAYSLYFDSSFIYRGWNRRYFGRSVRPVTD